MATTISHESCCDCRKIFLVKFFNHRIEASLTSSPEYVTAWVRKIEQIHRNRLGNKFVVGLDFKWRPNFRPNVPENPIALIQICVGHKCLIFQFHCATEVPEPLVRLLTNRNYNFVGVDIETNVDRFFEEFGIEIFYHVDLGPLASDRLQIPQLSDARLEILVEEVLGKPYYKPTSIIQSNWDNSQLSDEQIQVATLDAFLCFEMGRFLYSKEYEKSRVFPEDFPHDLMLNSDWATS